jgi:quercetin dioxygenase-like cupin family protein
LNRFGASAVLLIGSLATGAARANGAPQSEEDRISEILQSALVAHGGEVHRCFEKALADTLDVAGKLELEVDVGEGGRVLKAAPAADEVKSPVLLACLQQSAQSWTLSGIDAGSTVILPLAFEGQAAQWSIKVADAPDHGPPAPAGKKKGPRPPEPPFSVKLLVDEQTMRARQASLLQLTVAPANRIAMHKHPGAEMLYVLKGHARVLGRAGQTPEKLDEGMAIFIQPGAPHAIENMGRQTPAVLLDFFVPPGPERVFRDPNDPAGRAAFEVIHGDASPGPAGGVPAGHDFLVANVKDVAPTADPGAKWRVRWLLDPATTGRAIALLGVLEADPGAQIARHDHSMSAEILFVVAGEGELTVGSEKVPFAADQAIHIQEKQPHAFKFTGTDKTVMVQVYAPASVQLKK